MSNELTFQRATIRRNGQILSLNALIQAATRGEFGDTEIDWAAGDRILVGVDSTRPEREFTVGPYTITID